MKIGIEASAVKGCIEQKYQKLKELGFDCVDFGMANTNSELYLVSEEEAKERLLRVRTEIEAAGMEVSQVHGPWRYPPVESTEEERAERLEKMQKSIRYTAFLGCKNWVVHPIMPYGLEDKGTELEAATWQLNIEFMKELLKTAKENGVTICLENMPFREFSLSTPEDILRVVREINDEQFKVCLDTGHAAVFEGLTPGMAARQFGKEIRVLHVHDNDGKEDLHRLPYFGVVDWKDFYQALEEIGFDGVFSYETEPSFKMPAPVREDLLRLMVKQVSFFNSEE